jgi:20S proteasome subunit beta 6
MISIMMYGRRFFPYYTNTVITGLDTDGKGCIFGFDPVGSMTQQRYSCDGSAMPLILPILDAHVSQIHKYLSSVIFVLKILGKNTTNPGHVKRTKEETVKMIKDVYMAACERNVEIGDGVVIHILTKDKGIETDVHPLRKD